MAGRYTNSTDLLDRVSIGTSLLTMFVLASLSDH